MKPKVQILDKGAQFRSRRIPARLWQEHKDDILRLYRGVGREAMMKWMEDEKAFFATWPQYKYQIYTKWRFDGEHDENASTGDNTTKFQTSNGPNKGSERSQERQKHAQSPRTKIEEESDEAQSTSPTTETPMSATSQQKMPQTEKAHKRGRSISQTSLEGLIKRQKAQPEDALPTKEQPEMTRGRNHDSKYTFEHEDDGRNGTSSGFHPNANDTSPSGSGRNAHQTAETIVGRPDLLQTSQNSQSPGPESLDRADWLIVDYDRPVSTYTRSDMLRIQLAADALLFRGLREQAFGLYFLVLIHHNPRKTYEEERNAMLGCARSAKTVEDIEMIRDEVEKRTSGKRDSRLRREDKFLLHMQLADEFIRQGRDSMAYLELNRAYFIMKLVNVKSIPNDGLDFVRSYETFLNRLLPGVLDEFKVQHNFATTRTQEKLENSDSEAAFTLASAGKEADVVQLLYNWCIEQMENLENFHTYNVKNHHPEEPAHLIVYAYLWDSWVSRRYGRLGAEAQLSSSVIVCGISIPELIAIMSCIIVGKGQESPTTLVKVAESFARKDFWQPLLPELLKEIGMVFADQRHLSQLPDMDLLWEEYGGNAHIEIVQKRTRIHLPTIPILQHQADLLAQKSVKTIPELYPKDTSNVSSSSLNSPYFAPSIASSSMSSFRRLADRIKSGGRATDQASVYSGRKNFFQRSFTSLWNQSRVSVDLSENMSVLSLQYHEAIRGQIHEKRISEDNGSTREDL